MTRVGSGFLRVAATLLIVALVGCGTRDYMDPTQIGRFRPTPVVNVILDSLGVAEEEPPIYKQAEEPKPMDVVAIEEDYVFGAGDVIRIGIFELLRETEMAVDDYVVSETGKISIPDVGQVKAAGLTESQLEEEIRQILSPAILKTPTVTVRMISSESRIFTLLGDGVPKPSRYSIPRYNFRLSEALAIGGSVSQYNISYIYVVRTVTGREPLAEEANLVEEAAVKAKEGETAVKTTQVELKPVEPNSRTPLKKSVEEEMFEIIAPYARTDSEKGSRLISSAEMTTDKELAEAMGSEGIGREDIGGEPQSQEEMGGLILENQPGSIEWIYQDGKWIPVRTDKGVVEERPQAPLKEELPKAPPVRERLPEEFGWEEIGTGGVQTRVIKIPVDKLLGGDPHYDIVIKAGDRIWVPVDVLGEFCVIGNTNSQGYVRLTGRPMTLMQAVAAAGGLNPLAWPERVEVRRRISRNREEIVMVNLRKIAEGTQPDFFIKPNDTINIGSHPAARWMAVLRNAFRATYGFGFIYDRNFADRDFGNSPFPGHISLKRIF